MIYLDILSEEYKDSFVDILDLSSISSHLVGLASVIEQSHEEWRPTVSQLLALLREYKNKNALVSAGHAFGVAKVLEIDFPGPAILLYGSALNTIGSHPNIELSNYIFKAINVLSEHDLLEEDNIKQLVLAAKERASFDKVSEMLREEFRAGLIDSGKYEISEIDEFVPKIVNVTHDVRHKGLIERIKWVSSKHEIGGSSTDASYMSYIDDIKFVYDELRNLTTPASLGCSYSIFRRLDQLR